MTAAFQIPRLTPKFDPRLRRAIEELKKRHGGGAVSFGLHADRPAPSQDNLGSVYVPSNSPLFYVSDGDNWRVFDPRNFQEMEPPVLTDFPTTVGLSPPNHTATQAGDEVYLHDFQVGFSIRGVFKPAPATPYTITASFTSNAFFITSAIWLFGYDGTQFKGIGAQQEANRREIYCGNFSDSLGTVFTNFQSYETHDPLPCFFRMADNGTNISYSLSNDGINFIPFFTNARTTNSTPTKVGVGWYNQNGVVPSGFHWLSWREE